jgi:hypothetical protein
MVENLTSPLELILLAVGTRWHPFAAGYGAGGYRGGASSMIFSKSPAYDWRFYGAALMFGCVVFAINLFLEWSKQESRWWSLFGVPSGN